MNDPVTFARTQALGVMSGLHTVIENLRQLEASGVLDEEVAVPIKGFIGSLNDCYHQAHVLVSKTPPWKDYPQPQAEPEPRHAPRPRAAEEDPSETLSFDRDQPFPEIDIPEASEG